MELSYLSLDNIQFFRFVSQFIILFMTIDVYMARDEKFEAEKMKKNVKNDER